MQMWTYAAIGVAGLIAGVLFKVGFMIAASIAIALVVGCVALIEGEPTAATLGSVVAALLSFQSAYLIGLLVSSECHRRRQIRR